jgi:hypothetical protein
MLLRGLDMADGGFGLGIFEACDGVRELGQP